MTQAVYAAQPGLFVGHPSSSAVGSVDRTSDALDARFVEIVETTSRQLRRVAFLFTGNWADADDMLQATFLKAYRHRTRVCEVAAPQAYLKQILLRTCIDETRRRKRLTEQATEELPEVPSDGDPHDEKWAVRAALRRVPAAQREILILRFYADMSVEETAKLVGCSAGNDNYAARSTADMPLIEVVQIAQTQTSLTAAPSMPHGNAKVTLTAAVTSAGGTPSGVVTLSLVGSATPLATVKLDAAGRATWSAPWMVAFGTSQRAVVATFAGNAQFAGSSSAPVTVAPTCDTVITGQHAGLTIGSGTTCIASATINGSVMVANGASVVIDRSTVTGPIMTSNAGGVRICGSTTADITVTGSTGYVVIGSAENFCAANTVHGSLTATKNTGGLVIVGNVVSGPVTTAKNTGAGPFADQQTPLVTGNHS